MNKIMIKSIKEVTVKYYSNTDENYIDGINVKKMIVCGYEGDNPALNGWKHKLLESSPVYYGMKADKQILWKAHLFYQENKQLRYSELKELRKNDPIFCKYYSLVKKINRLIDKKIEIKIIYLSYHDKELAILIQKYVNWLLK